MTHDLASMPLETLLQQTPLPMAAADATGRLTTLTPALQRLMNQPFRGAYADEWCATFNLCTEDGQTPLPADEVPLTQALRGEVVSEAVISTRVDDGHVVFLRCDATPVRNEAGEIVGALAVVQDVTAERVAHRRQEELRQRLVLTINHELRTPVTKIVGHAEILQDESPAMPRRLHGSVDVIARAADDLLRLAGVISDLSDLAARSRLAKTYCNVAALVRDVVSAFTVQATARDLGLEIVAPTRIAATIDPDQVGRAVAALLDNAVTYAPSGSSIDVEVVDGAECVEIRVHDAGGGIPTQDSARLLQPFERGNHPLQPVSSKGLGLAVAHTVATAHVGELVFSDREPAGFCATLRLPRHGV